MIRVKNGELMNSIEVLNDLANLKIPFKTSFKLMRITDKVAKIVEDVQKVRQKLVETYTQKDENGVPVFAKNENGEVDTTKVVIENPNEFRKELDDLFNTEVEIEGDKIPVDDFSNVEIEPRKLIFINWLFS